MKYAYFVLVCGLLLFSYGCKNEPIPVYHEEFAELDSVIRVMEEDLLPLEKEITELAEYVTYVFNHQEEFVGQAKQEDYKISQDGVVYREQAAGDKSSVFVSNISPNITQAYHQVYYTEVLDSAFASIQSKTPFISQVYLNTHLQMCRIYPSMDVLNVFNADMDLTTFNFYYMADEVRNPERSYKWVEDIYVDPAGRGWILSLIHPIYANGELEGVLGLDITVNDITTRFLSYNDKKLLLIDGAGNIVAGNSDAFGVLNLPPLRNHTYVQTINSDNFRKEDYNLFKSKSKEIRKMVAKFLLEKDNTFVIKNEYSHYEYTVFCRQMNLLNWYVLEVKG